MAISSRKRAVVCKPVIECSSTMRAGLGRAARGAPIVCMPGFAPHDSGKMVTTLDMPATTHRAPNANIIRLTQSKHFYL